MSVWQFCDGPPVTASAPLLWNLQPQERRLPRLCLASIVLTLFFVLMPSPVHYFTYQSTHTTAEEAGDVAAYLVPRIREVPPKSSTLTGGIASQYIQYLTKPKAYGQILSVRCCC